MYLCRWRCGLKRIVERALKRLGKGNRKAMARTAKPWTSVRFRSLPPEFWARVAELVDATDLKSVGIFPVPVRVRPWAPEFNYLELLISSFLFTTKAVKASLIDGSRAGCSYCFNKDFHVLLARSSVVIDPFFSQFSKLSQSEIIGV